MSYDLDEPLPPRRPVPKPKPDASSTPLAEGQDTFRASGAGSGSAPLPPSTSFGPRKASAKGDREPRPVSGGPNFFERLVYGKVSSGHLATFCGQFATYQDAGVDLMRTLTSLRKQFGMTALGPVVGRMEAGVRGGDSLAEVMGRETQAFDNLCLAMIRVAEARGGIPETLRTLSKHYEARQRMIRQARSALIQPAIVLSIAAVVVLLLTIYVIPKMVEFIADGLRGKAVELPFPTRVLMSISRFMQGQGWWIVPLTVVTVVFGAFRWYKTAAGKAMFDSLSLYIPILGKVRRLIETGRFARTLAALLHAGVDIGTSLDLTSGVMGLAPFRRAILGVKKLVMDGTELSDALMETNRFPSDVIAIVNSGEESGRLPEALDKLADDYEEKVEYIVKNLGSLIQPILVIGLGGVVLFIVLGVILAYLQMLQSAMG